MEMQKFDAVVGDTTIIADRTSYVDFTLPYFESGVRMVVKVKDDKRNNMWIFLKPLCWDLWLITGCAFIFTALVVWVLEHSQNSEFRGSRQQQVGTTLWFSFSTLVFAHSKQFVLTNCTYLQIFFTLVTQIYVQYLLIYKNISKLILT